MSMFFKHGVLVLAAIAILTTTQSCGVSEKTCLRNDWQTLGYSHGEQGKPADALNRFVKDCAEHGVTPDATAYSAGYDVGVKVYCTAENGAKAGGDVEIYEGVCPANLEKAFLENYIDGLRLAKDDLQIEYDRDTIELDRLRANRDRLAAAGESHVRDDKRIKSIVSAIEQNTDDRLDINEYIREWSGRI